MSYLYFLLGWSLFAIVVFFAWLVFGQRPKPLPRYSLDDLINHRKEADLNELEARIASDGRSARHVCKVRRTDGPTPCWWPFCDCE